MTVDASRRSLLAATLGLAATTGLGLRPAGAQGRQAPLQRLMALERRHGGRLGVAVYVADTGRRINHRGEQRFPMCSTFKFLAAAQVLARVDRGEEDLERPIVFDDEVLVTYSPVTQSRTGPPGMTVAELCHAAVAVSDNTAANLLLATLGGPGGLTAFLRSLGDRHTRLDRIEPELNEATPGDPRDTTTPAAMLADMRALLLGDSLSPPSRTRLADWLAASTTGGRRLRAGFPPDWRAGDKTGTSGNGVFNDIAIAWPPGRGPRLVTAYYAGSSASAAQADAVLAEVGRIVATL
ncbi:class A beta-lactamase [Luteimonas vadosa]|uniref:Beta-lactamase n=1 Tax=Luteimonas vadosa TaxID=1165507 RepID=A0ABP9E604_9GAMM